jgi:hypothetical protein
MYRVASRAGRWPLALSLAALTALSACADDAVAPKTPSRPNLTASAAADDFVELTVTNASGGLEIGSLRSEVNQIRSGGGAIHFDPSLDGATITLDAPLNSDGPLYIVGPAKGITLSGNDQHRIIDGTAPISAKNVTFTKGYGDYASAIRAGSVYLDNSTVRDNRGPGSAIRAQYTLSLINSTVSRNVVGAAAVEYRESSQVFIDNSTIAYNAPGAGLGVFGYPTYALRVTLNNSILSNNGSPQLNCSSFFNFYYEGTNISNDWSCGEVGIVVADPLLMPLANNGGPNLTHAIPHTSPAFNAGMGCYVQTDQRYVPRDAKCDVGAFEFNDFTKVTITIDPSTKVNATTGRALLTGTVKCTRNDTFRLALELYQDQKVNGQVVDVHAASDIPVACTTSAQPWSATMALSNGEVFQAGAARATAQTFNTPEWVTPASAASAVKISFTRK